MPTQAPIYVNHHRAQLMAAVDALRDPASYPEPVGSVEVIETHMSFVFLTERHAYKLKKPIRTPLLDHSTLQARLNACQREVELNRRLAQDVYLGVVPLLQSDGALRVEGAGVAVDWLVKMRRLPRERMLDACIARGAVEQHEVERLAERLVAFYASAERAPLPPRAYVENTRADLAAKRVSLEQPRYGLERAQIARVADAQLRWLAQHAALLEARASRVLDGHGDLRPEHVCLEAQPVVIDCLEFDRDLRLLDPLSELSFLALECRRLGAAWIGEQLLACCMRAAGEPPQPALLAFYQSYHALVRAAVAIWHLDDDGLDHVSRFRDRARAYLQLAQQLL